jgi:hypothetical protein
MKKTGLILILVLGGVGALFFARRSSEQILEQSRDPRGADPRGTGTRGTDTPVCPSSQTRVSASQVSPSQQGRELVLSDAVKTILSSNSSYSVRTQQIKTLGRNLSADDVAALRTFLLLPPSEVPNLKPHALNSIKNDILEILMNQQEMPEGLGQQADGWTAGVLEIRRVNERQSGRIQ